MVDVIKGEILIPFDPANPSMGPCRTLSAYLGCVCRQDVSVCPSVGGGGGGGGDGCVGVRVSVAGDNGGGPLAACVCASEEGYVCLATGVSLQLCAVCM